MNLSSTGRILRLGFFLRIPVLTLLLLGSLGPLSQLSAARSLLSNLFDAQNDAGRVWGNAFAISSASFLLAFTAVTTFNLTLCYGGLRFGEDPQALVRSDDDPGGWRLAKIHSGWMFTLGLLAACSVVGLLFGGPARRFCGCL